MIQLVKYTLLFFFVLLFTTLQPIMAQQEGYAEKALPFSVNRDGLYPICVNEHMKDPQRIARAIEDTKTFAPGVYHEIMAASNRSSNSQLADIGERRKFSVYNFQFNRYDLIEAELRALGASSEIWVQVSEIDNGHVDTATVPYIMLDNLEKHTPPQSKDSTKGIKKLDEQFFGNPPNIGPSGIKGTGNGRVTILITDIQDGFDSTKGGKYVAGFFDPNDQMLNVASNRRDMLYIDSYPGIHYRGRTRLNTALGVVAHEYEHLIHFNYDPHELTFVDEGLADYGTYICGYGMGDPAEYFSNTNVPMFDWDNISGSVIADYDRARIWTLYIMEQIGDSLARRVVQSPLHGIKGYNNALILMATPQTFSSLFQTWLIANYLNDRTISNAYGYLYQGLSRVKPQREFNSPDHVTIADSIYALASNYVRYSGGDSLSIKFTINEGSIIIKAIEVGPIVKRVVDVPVGAYFFEPDFGPLYSEVVFVIMNTNATPIDPSTQIGARYSFTSSMKERRYVNVQKIENTMLLQFALSQNYPNPFNPTTSVKFRVSSFGFVSLKVYDVLGREVVKLVDENKPAGEYTVEFNGTNLSSGVYFYRLTVESSGQVNKFTDIKKMILAK